LNQNQNGQNPLTATSKVWQLVFLLNLKMLLLIQKAPIFKVVFLHDNLSD
jgi:hypothetical protein